MSTRKDEGYVEHKLEHYKQRFNWDCGVSCVIMLLTRGRREELINRLTEICEEEGFYQSTWTVDLSYLLKRFGIKHSMYTTQFGVNEGYQKHNFYGKILNIDRDRVNRRFDTAASLGIEVNQHSLSHQELISHLTHCGPAVVLVDAGLMVCDLCKHNKLKFEFRRCFGGSYVGHYIVLVGYSRGKLLYRDPAIASRICATTPARFERARRTVGTDHDVILIFNDYR